MSTVIGLSLTADVIGWVLVDVDDGTVFDHDVLDVTADTETAAAAVLGAHAIATTAGHEIDGVRITWSDDAAHAGFRLQCRLRGLALPPIEAVAHCRALAVLVGPEQADMASDIAVAYGAALATVAPGEPSSEPVSRRLRRRVRPRQLLTSVLGVAAAVSLGVFGLGAAGGPDIAPAATAVEQPAPADAGWVAVPATPPSPAVAPVRKVAAVPSPRAAAPSVDAPVYYPPQAVAATAAPEAAPVVVVEPEGPPLSSAPEPAAVPHLGAPEPVAVPHLGAPEPVAVPHAADPLGPHVPGPPGADIDAGPEMTDPFNLFTGLP